MAVLPINNVSAKANSITFTSKPKRDNENKYAGIPERQDSNSLAKVPVIVMLAMAPMMSDGKKPAQIMPIDNKALTEVLAQAPANPMIVENVPQIRELRSGIKAIDEQYHIHHICNVTGNGQKGRLIFADYNTNDKADKDIYKIFYVEDRYANKNYGRLNPPHVVGLIYHDLGPGKEFCGIKIHDNRFDEKYNIDTHEYEVRINDEAAQKVIDLLTGDTEWNNVTFIRFEETKSQNLLNPRVF